VKTICDTPSLPGSSTALRETGGGSGAALDPAHATRDRRSEAWIDAMLIRRAHPLRHAHMGAFSGQASNEGSSEPPTRPCTTIRKLDDGRRKVQHRAAYQTSMARLATLRRKALSFASDLGPEHACHGLLPHAFGQERERASVGREAERRGRMMAVGSANIARVRVRQSSGIMSICLFQ